jgi:hypothetical protein
MLAVKRSSLFFVKGLKFFFFLIESKYLVFLNYFNPLHLSFFKNLTFFFFSSSFVSFFFRNIFFFNFLNPYCLLVFPLDFDDFVVFFKDFSSDIFMVGFSIDFFFFNSRFFSHLDFSGISCIYIFFFFFKFYIYIYIFFFFFALNKIFFLAKYMLV